MPSGITRLRRWFAFGAVLMIATVAGMYFYARWSLRKAVHAIPAKIGLDIQQTAEGFSISKSVEGRTLFKVSASKAVQFKGGGRAELQKVKIVIYGRDASRFDQIVGDDFEYDPATGNVSAKGKVLIDLEANPGGMQHSDQSDPVRAKEPIHLETNDLVFNKNTGDASASGTVVFETPQASGSAVGIEYVSKTGVMKLTSGIELTVNRPQSIHLRADHGVISKDPKVVTLSAVHVDREAQQLKSDEATFFLRADNTVERILGAGNVEGEFQGGRAERSVTHSSTQSSSPSTPHTPSGVSGTDGARAVGQVTHERSDRAELFLTGNQNQLTSAILTGNVRISSAGAQPMDAAAGRVTLRFGPQQALKTVHAEGGVRLAQKGNGGAVVMASAAGKTPLATGGQDIEMTAPVMDFTVKGGRIIQRAETSGPPEIILTQASAGQKTTVTAAKFTAKFTDNNRLATLHGEPDAKIVSTVAGGSGSAQASGSAHSTRSSTSRALDVVFLPAGGIASLTQSGSVVYVDGTQKAWAQRGEYTASDQTLVLSGSPRVVDGGMSTTAQVIRVNRSTGDAMADGDVKSTYSDLKAKPEGGMLSSSDPIHVTSRTMTAHRSSADALYSGDARLWQDANVVEAPTLQFDRDSRSLVAEDGKNGGGQPVSTVLVQVEKSGKATPVRITSGRLKYADEERRIFLDGGVTAKAADASMTAEHMTVYLVPRSKAVGATSTQTPGQLDRIVAEGKVVVTQPTRHASGEQLEYTAGEDKFVLRGGMPSIFDAERGKVRGESLTFYRHDDRVLVEGRETSPTVTKTQVAR